MKKILILIITSICCLECYSNDSLIYWNSTTKLKFSDFKSRIDSNSSNRAISFTGIVGDYNIDPDSNLLEYKIRAYFVPKKSWIKSNNALVLAHEQIHFDIAELYARKLRKGLSYLKFNFGIEEQINNIVKEIDKELQNAQSLFDEDTSFFIDVEKEKNWAIKISNELKILNDFK